MAQVALRAVSAVSTQGSKLSNFDLVIDKPTGTVSGDLMLAHIALNYSSSSISAVPSGWTLTDSDSSNFGGFVYQKIAGGSEPSTYTWSVSVLGSTSAVGAISSWTNPHQTTPVDVKSERANASSTTATGDTITPTTAPESVLLFFVAYTGGAYSVSGYAVANNNPSWTEAYDYVVDSGLNDAGIALAYASRDLITATGSATATISSAAANYVNILSIRPAGFALDVPVAVVETAGLAASESMVASVSVPVATVAIAGQATTVAEGDVDFTNTQKNTGNWINTQKT